MAFNSANRQTLGCGNQKEQKQISGDGDSNELIRSFLGTLDQHCQCQKPNFRLTVEINQLTYIVIYMLRLFTL